jgi:hypothetical protein
VPLCVATWEDATLRVTDTAGTIASLKLSKLQRVPRLYATRTPGDTTSDVRWKELLQTVRLTKNDVLRANDTLDWAHLKKLEIAMDVEGHTKGAAFITNIDVSD